MILRRYLSNLLLCVGWWCFCFYGVYLRPSGTKTLYFVWMTAVGLLLRVFWTVSGTVTRVFFVVILIRFRSHSIARSILKRRSDEEHVDMCAAFFF